jgi:hypothetical protein
MAVSEHDKLSPATSREFEICGKAIVVEWEPMDFTKWGLKEGNPLLKWGVSNDDNRGTVYEKVLVSERAEPWYQGLAVLHEQMCQRDIAKEIAPDLVESDEFNGDAHCAAVEKFVINEVIGDDIDLADKYINARIEMFEAIVALYPDNVMFRTALDYLKSLPRSTT